MTCLTAVDADAHADSARKVGAWGRFKLLFNAYKLRVYVQGIHSAGYESVGCCVLGLQCLYVRLRTDWIRQDVHNDG